MRRPAGGSGKLEYFYRGAEGRPVVYIARNGIPLERRQLAQPRLRHVRSSRGGKIVPGH